MGEVLDRSLEVVQFGASHGVLDLGTRVNMFRGPVLDVLKDDPSVKKVVIYEDAGGLGFDDAKLITENSEVRRSVVDGFFGYHLHDADAIDRHMLSNLYQGPLAEHSHYAMSLLFFDWLMAKTRGRTDVDFMPEHNSGETVSCNENNAQKIKPMSFEGMSLEGAIDHYASKQADLDSLAYERDKGIAASLEKIYEVNGGTRLQIVIIIGNGHQNIQDSISSDFVSHVNYRTLDGPAAVDVTSIDIESGVSNLGRYEVARNILLGLIARFVKDAFLKKHADLILKMPGQLDNGENVFERLRNIAKTFSEDVIYMLLQEWSGIDCGLDKADYPDVVLPMPFDLDLGLVQANLLELNDNAGVIDMSTSEIGTYINKRFVCYSLYRMLGVDEVSERLVIRSWIMSELKADKLKVLKAELVMYFQSGGAIPCHFLQFLVTKLFRRKPKYMSNIDYKKLQNVFRRVSA